MVAASEQLLGIGLYTPAEAAFYARVSPQKLGRWVFGNKMGAAVFTAQRSGETRDVSFLDFIQALSVRAVRTQYPEVPLTNIREAIREARNTYRTPFPLAVRKHRIYVRGRGLLIKVSVRDDDAELIELNRAHRGQRAFVQVVECFVKDVEFDSISELAIRYTCFKSESGKVVMDPKVRMGEPLISGCGYSALALAQAAKDEGGINAAARTYGVSVKDIEVACEYFDLLQPAA